MYYFVAALDGPPQFLNKDFVTFVTNVEDAKPKNHRGWKNDLDDCYFARDNCGAPPPQVYSACSSQGIFDEFSIALTGKEKK